MGERSTKYRVINTLIMNIPICVAIVITAQLLGTGTVRLNLSLLNFTLAYLISFIVGMCVPLVPWGIAFAQKCGTQPGTLPFGLAINAVVNLGYVVVNSIALTWFNVVFLGHAPIIAFFFSMISGFVPIYLVGYIVSFLWNGPCEKITQSICGE